MKQIFCVGVICSAMLLVGCGRGAPADEAPARPRPLTLDTHVDIPDAFMREPRFDVGGDSVLKVDLAKMERGGLDAVFFVIFVGQGPLTPEGYSHAVSVADHKYSAIELMVEGGLFTFERAHELGIVNYVWPAEENGRTWWDRVLEYAGGFCPPGRASRAVGLIKRSVQSGWEVPLESALALERELQQQLFQSEDAKEGVAASIEKRTPSFSGK